MKTICIAASSIYAWQRSKYSMKYLTLRQIEELKEFDTPTILNAIESMAIRRNTEGFCYPGMLLRTPAVEPMVGYAVTGKISGIVPPTAGQRNMLFDYYADVRELNVPSVCVLQDIDENPIGSFWGEVQATAFKALGAVGTITQGGVRDLKEVSSLGFQFFSTDIMVARAESHMIDRKCPVKICGLTINPGDLIHADLHGVTLIPAEAAPKLAEACRKIVEAEALVLNPCRKAIENGIKPTIDELRQWRGEMNKRRQAVKEKV